MIRGGGLRSRSRERHALFASGVVESIIDRYCLR
jgi:hypothetical protein